VGKFILTPNGHAGFAITVVVCGRRVQGPVRWEVFKSDYTRYLVKNKKTTPGNFGKSRLGGALRGLREGFSRRYNAFLAKLSSHENKSNTFVHKTPGGKRSCAKCPVFIENPLTIPDEHAKIEFCGMPFPLA